VTVREPVETVLLDAGGVLIMPASKAVLAILRSAGVHLGPRDLDQAHYFATAANDARPPRNRMLYLRAFARACGVPEDRVETVVAGLDGAIEGPHWTRPVPGAARALRALNSLPVTLGVVSNSIGVVADQLRCAGICHEGPGPGTQVGVVIDSAVVGTAKPDPAIFRLALERLGGQPHRAVYVGDTARIDVDGALAAGLHALHLDPYGNCPDPPGQHEHLRRLADLTSWIREHGPQ
jgi:putative hydrolase of the HAD superfamily